MFESLVLDPAAKRMLVKTKHSLSMVDLKSDSLHSAAEYLSFVSLNNFKLVYSQKGLSQ